MLNKTTTPKNLQTMPTKTKQQRVVAALAAVLLVFAAAACETTQNDVAESKAVQSHVMDAAIAAAPAYTPTNFPARHDINRYLQETEETTEWYTYALNFDGQPIFYVVSDNKPRNICVSITAPDRVLHKSSHGIVTGSAPALDGVYYGGANCDAYYLWDAATGNFIEIAGSTYTLISTKAPLTLETDIPALTWANDRS